MANIDCGGLWQTARVLFIYFILFIYLLTEHLHFQRNITVGQQGTNK